jgi:hypothetical protein
MKTVGCVQEYPLNQHGCGYIILVEKPIQIPGDERSRTDPGHGYPAHALQCWEVLVPATTKEMQEWLERNHQSAKYVIIRGDRQEIRKATVFTVGDKVFP